MDRRVSVAACSLVWSVIVTPDVRVSLSPSEVKQKKLFLWPLSFFINIVLNSCKTLPLYIFVNHSKQVHYHSIKHLVHLVFLFTSFCKQMFCLYADKINHKVPLLFHLHKDEDQSRRHSTSYWLSPLMKISVSIIFNYLTPFKSL